MNERTHEFLKKIGDYNGNNIAEYFGDIFSEFINELNEVDLSEKTLKHLNDIFDKDMKIFFRELKESDIDV